jgi:hypothetical protein
VLSESISELAFCCHGRVLRPRPLSGRRHKCWLLPAAYANTLYFPVVQRDGSHETDPIEENFEQESRDYNIDDEGRLSDSPTKESVSRSEARFHYEYDALSNWVNKAVESRPGADRDRMTIFEVY